MYTIFQVDRGVVDYWGTFDCLERGWVELCELVADGMIGDGECFEVYRGNWESGIENRKGLEAIVEGLVGRIEVRKRGTFVEGNQAVWIQDDCLGQQFAFVDSIACGS